MTKVKLSVIVPCYNEEERFLPGFEHYYSYLKKQKYLWELIFVNDGSTDQTHDLMLKVAKNKRNVRVINYYPNHGKGYAIVQGIKVAKGHYILFTDIDHSVPIDTIENFFPHFGKDFQVVIGSRRVKGANIIVHQHPIREFLGRGFTLLVNFLIYPGIADATCGFKAFENSVAKKIFNKVTIYDWAFDAEILFLCKKYQIRIAQAPVVWSDVRGSKVSLKRDIFRSLLGLLKIHLNNLRSRYN